jgi:hypothetical protein
MLTVSGSAIFSRIPLVFLIATLATLLMPSSVLLLLLLLLILLPLLVLLPLLPPLPLPLPLPLLLLPLRVSPISTRWPFRSRACV